MRRARDRVALVEIVGAHPHLHQGVDQLPHGLHVVVDPLQEDGLRAERQAGVGQQVAGPGGLVAALVGMHEVQAHPERVVAAEHAHELRCDALGQDGGDLGADADHLHMADGAQALQDPLQALVAQGERVAAGDQHVADLRVAGDVVEGGLQALRLGRQRAVPHDARARAVAAVGGAVAGHQQEHAVGIAVHHALDRALVILPEGIVGLAGALAEFINRRDHRAADGLLGIQRIDEAHVVRGHGEGQQAAAEFQRLLLVDREADHLAQEIQRLDAVTQLPLPVAPLLVGGVGKEGASEAPARGIHAHHATRRRLFNGGAVVVVRRGKQGGYTLLP